MERVADMSRKIWTNSDVGCVGLGNNHRAVVYMTPGFPNFGVEPIWSVLVFAQLSTGTKRVGKFTANSEAAVKRWAEKNYLRGTK